jgi:hypothetical protein
MGDFKTVYNIYNDALSAAYAVENYLWGIWCRLNIKLVLRQKCKSIAYSIEYTYFWKAFFGTSHGSSAFS